MTAHSLDLNFTHIVSIEFWLQAEARLAAKRAARAEARSIRSKELERQQQEGGNVSHD